MQINVIMFKEDDPHKCTAAKLIRFKLAKKIKKPSPKCIILDPFSQKILLPNEKHVKSITAVDCSWNSINYTCIRKFPGIHRRLPPLFAGNPINYSKLSKLTTIEAITATLFIFGYNDIGLKLLNKFSWGHTFFELNRGLLEDYSKLRSMDEIKLVLYNYGITNT